VIEVFDFVPPCVELEGWALCPVFSTIGSPTFPTGPWDIDGWRAFLLDVAGWDDDCV
jgi:hypothetical protein